jgi:hypothetical protein
MYLCCKPPKDESEGDENKLSQKELLVKMIKVIKAKYQGVEVFNPIWGALPCHTAEGWTFLALSAGWLAWCLNYLILFAASHPSSVGQNIMISYATSELTTVFITQPITIIVTYSIFKLSHRYKDYIPQFLHRFILITPKHDIPASQFFSNPFSHMTQSAFTAKFAYSLFVKCPAAASNPDELAYAPTKAIIHDIEAQPISKVEQLYLQILDIKSSLEEESR